MEEPAGKTISYADFSRVEMRAGRIIKAEVFTGARIPAYKLLINFGELGEKKSSAQVTDLYTPDELQGRMVIAVTNFPPKQIGNFMSEVLVLGVMEEGKGVVLLQPDQDVLPGARVY
jgi:tRNA-binding protein